MFPQAELENYRLQVELLQEKLKRSEEQRQQLEEKFKDIAKRRNEKEQQAKSKSLQKYQEFLDEQRNRNERNKALVKILEQADHTASVLATRSERLRSLKIQYELYLTKMLHNQSFKSINDGPFCPVVAEIKSLHGRETAQNPNVHEAMMSNGQGKEICQLANKENSNNNTNGSGSYILPLSSENWRAFHSTSFESVQPNALRNVVGNTEPILTKPLHSKTQKQQANSKSTFADPVDYRGEIPLTNSSFHLVPSETALGTCRIASEKKAKSQTIQKIDQIFSDRKIPTGMFISRGVDPLIKMSVGGDFSRSISVTGNVSKALSNSNNIQVKPVGLTNLKTLDEQYCHLRNENVATEKQENDYKEDIKIEDSSNIKYPTYTSPALQNHAMRLSNEDAPHGAMNNSTNKQPNSSSRNNEFATSRFANRSQPDNIVNVQQTSHPDISHISSVTMEKSCIENIENTIYGEKITPLVGDTQGNAAQDDDVFNAFVANADNFNEELVDRDFSEETPVPPEITNEIAIIKHEEPEKMYDKNLALVDAINLNPDQCASYVGSGENASVTETQNVLLEEQEQTEYEYSNYDYQELSHPQEYFQLENQTDNNNQMQTEIDFQADSNGQYENQENADWQAINQSSEYQNENYTAENWNQLEYSQDDQYNGAYPNIHQYDGYTHETELQLNANASEIPQQFDSNDQQYMEPNQQAGQLYEQQLYQEYEQQDQLECAQLEEGNLDAIQSYQPTDNLQYEMPEPEMQDLLTQDGNVVSFENMKPSTVVDELPPSILSTEKANDSRSSIKKKKKVNFVDSENDDSLSLAAPNTEINQPKKIDGTISDDGNHDESDFDFCSSTT